MADGAAHVDFEAGFRGDDTADYEDMLFVDIDGFEGPLHLLLDLARRQKVDLLQVSVLDLADSYLAFVEDARLQRIDLAADFLVMASWLALLKSRMLLPKLAAGTDSEASDPTSEAAWLAFRLKRLATMREASANLMSLSQLGSDVRSRGAPQSRSTVSEPEFNATLHDLMKAFAVIHASKQTSAPHSISVQLVLPLETARQSLEVATRDMFDWTELEAVEVRYLEHQRPAPERSRLASLFAASLELSKAARVDLRQDAYRAPVLVRGVEAGL